MSSPFYQRKWAGPPHSELKKEAPPEPSKLSKRKPGGSPKPVIKKASQWNMYRDRPRETQYRCYWWDRMWHCPYLGVDVRGWLGGCQDHVLRRLRGMLMEDSDAKIYFIIAHHNGKQISPEFSSYENLNNWLIYEGLKRGWLKVTKQQEWKTNKWYYRLEAQ